MSPSRPVVYMALVAPAVATTVGANPVRKVVNLLQAMQKKVEAEGEKSDELHKKFMCYCQTSGGDLQASIEAAEEKIPQLAASIKAGTEKKVQLEADLKGHQTDRSAAKKAMAEATSLREKEKAAYDKALAENKANLGATLKATAAISQGMEGSFLQTETASVLRNLVNSQQNMASADRDELVAFLSGEQNSNYAPASGEIVGILKTMSDEMAADQQDMIAAETASVSDYEGLIAAKKKEVAALTKSIEQKMERVGELGVEIATLKDDGGDSAESLEEDKKFGADLKKNCAEKTGIHEQEQKVRSQEVVALADTIKILNDDDALDLFKKTLPSASMSLLQVDRTQDSLRVEAHSLLEVASKKMKSNRHRLDFVMLALNGKKIGFDKIVKLIDNLVATLKKEQVDDDNKKEYCDSEFDSSDDKKKGLELSISDLATVIEESKEGIATLTEEIKALKVGIVALDKQVSEATEQRRAEEAEHKELMQSDSAAKELILFAKNRMNKFYNPKLAKAESFVQLSMRKDAPALPPATAAAYTKKAEGSNGVIAMMNVLVSDLDKEMTISETENKNAQAEYEETIADASDKRRQDSKSLTDKEAAKADLEGALEKSTADKKSTNKDLMGTEKYIASLHGECDWLVKYHEVRKAARSDEVDALGKAKAVLNGADYSLLQLSHSHKLLRRA